MRGNARFVAAAVAAAAAAVGVLALAGVFDEDGDGPPGGALAQGDRSTVALVERVREGVVFVTARVDGGASAGGSGFMVDDEGFIVTNQHVVAGAAAVRVQAEGANGPIPAEVVGADPATDIAL